MAVKLFVGGISWDSTEDSLKTFFSQVGTVTSATIIIDKYSGRSKGFGFVEMSTDEEAKEAIEKLNGQTLDGRTIVVNEARPMVPRDNNGPRPSYGGDRGGRGGDHRGGHGGGNDRRGGGGRSFR
jgi:cold-inducible RNA-binding protein